MAKKLDITEQLFSRKEQKLEELVEIWKTIEQLEKKIQQQQYQNNLQLENKQRRLIRKQIIKHQKKQQFHNITVFQCFP